MTEPDIRKELSDGIIVCSGYNSNETVVIHTASKVDAEWIYNKVEPISEDRDIRKTGDFGLHRNYYLELAASDEHSLEDESEFGWNTKPVWMVTFRPSEYVQQRYINWMDETQSIKAPHDFKITPTIGELIYRAGAHEMSGIDDEPYIEFDATDLQKLDAELQNIGIRSINVGDLWRLDVENSEKFRDYIGVEKPTVTAVDTGGE